MRIILTVAAWFTSFYLAAQPTEDYSKFKEFAPNAEYVVSKMVNSIEISLKSNKLKVDYYNYEESFYLGENAKSYADRSINFSKFYVLKEYGAYTMVPDETKYKKYKVDTYNKNDFVSNGIFHDDQQEFKFIFPMIDKGVKTVMETDYEITDAHMLPKFSVNPYLNYFDVTFNLSYDNAIEMSIDSMNFEGLNCEHTILQKGGSIHHTWHFKSPKKYSFESSGPEIAFVSPQIIYRIKSYQTKGKTEYVLNTLDDLHKWYCGFLAQSDEGFDSFKKLSDSIVYGITEPMQKAAKIYDWVQKNIRYIAFEEGYAGLIPEKASAVCSERYGDCKGMANLLYHLLKSQNLDAHLCWIGTRSLPYKYSKNPGPGVDNHMIAALKTTNGYIYLDGTHANLAFGVPSPFIQGKETLINDADCKTYHLETVPIINPAENRIIDSCTVNIIGTALIGSGMATFTGYQRMDFMDGLQEKNYKFLLNHSRRYLLKGSNKFVLDTVWLQNAEEKNMPLLLHYKFKLPDYIVHVDNENYINLNLDKITIPAKLGPDRNVAVEYRYQNSEINIVMLQLNKNTQVSVLPEKSAYTDSNLIFENTYTKTENGILRLQNQSKKIMVLDVEDFKKYNKYIETIQKSYQQQIILKTDSK